MLSHLVWHRLSHDELLLLLLVRDLVIQVRIVFNLVVMGLCLLAAINDVLLIRLGS